MRVIQVACSADMQVVESASVMQHARKGDMAGVWALQKGCKGEAWRECQCLARLKDNAAGRCCFTIGNLDDTHLCLTHADF